MKIGVPDPQGTEFICRLKSNNSDPDPSIKLKKKKGTGTGTSSSAWKYF